MSQPDEAVPEEVPCRPPREAWPLARVLSLVLMKMGRAGPPFEPRRRPQAGKSGDPRSQNADKHLWLWSFNLTHRKIGAYSVASQPFTSRVMSTIIVHANLHPVGYIYQDLSNTM